MKNFVNKSNIRNQVFIPYFLTITNQMQAIFYILTEIVFKLRFPLKFERELFSLSDGGTIALDWVIDQEGGIPRKNS